MNNVEVDKVLAQMRLLEAQSKGPVEHAEDTEFSALLKQSIDKVNETQMQAGELARNFELGESDTNLSQVMVSIQKASVSFEAMVQVRNKLVEAYQDIMNMPM